MLPQTALTLAINQRDLNIPIPWVAEMVKVLHPQFGLSNTEERVQDLLDPLHNLPEVAPEDRDYITRDEAYFEAGRFFADIEACLELKRFGLESAQATKDFISSDYRDSLQAILKPDHPLDSQTFFCFVTAVKNTALFDKADEWVQIQLAKAKEIKAMTTEQWDELTPDRIFTVRGFALQLRKRASITHIELQRSSCIDDWSRGAVPEERFAEFRELIRKLPITQQLKDVSEVKVPSLTLTSSSGRVLELPQPAFAWAVDELKDIEEYKQTSYNPERPGWSNEYMAQIYGALVPKNPVPQNLFSVV